MDLPVDNGVGFRRAPTHAAALPVLDDVPIRTPSLLDRVGDQLNDRWGLVATGAGVGAGAAALLAARAGRTIGSTIRLGVFGALGGAALTIGIGAGIDALTRRGTAPSSSARAAGAPEAATEVRANETLRVMSFNIHGTAGPGGETFGSDADVERVARAIERERPDVVLLQEVDDHAPQSGFRDALAELADRLGADGAVHVPSVHTITGRRNGVAVLTFNGVDVADARGIVSPDARGEGAGRRIAGAVDAVTGFATKPFLDEPWTPFDAPQYRPRATADVLVATPAGTAVRVLSGHWSWPEGGIDHPRRQVDPLAGLLGAWEGPTIVGGDFNVKSNTPNGDLEAAAFERAGLVDAFTAHGIAIDDPARKTFGAGRPVNPIDRVYGSDELEVRDVRVGSHVVDGVGSSDHHPVIVDYRLNTDDS